MSVARALSPESVTELTRALDLSGVFANGTLGGVLARARRLDLFGFLVIGIVSGLGGGILRDTLLQHGTPVALTDYTYLTVAVAGTLLAFLADLSRHTSGWAFTLLDASALSVWAVAGAQKTFAVGLGWLPAVLLGTITAVGGGAIRDLLLARTPSIFGGTPLYATVAVLVSVVMVVCSRLGAPTVGVLAGIAVGIALRLAAFHWGWRLPGSRDWRPGPVKRRGP
ncbi:trimeric intracellular cation channel family protein [Streptomyces sp. FXJ1.172]|uniref:trimeric intracellular cation channel family protein n=1 Tax=Streptomyces sp. FXJ1.172 TaxID=710705 RepID=UPI0007CF602F|nr:trimeric intracellular cation channel family protein [Streptomyces sp. FXJ1.172]WEO93329.1 trimeric intracellular cation channel family protein [Streptomyces sp. FXJ1.172]